MIGELKDDLKDLQKQVDLQSIALELLCYVHNKEASFKRIVIPDNLPRGFPDHDYETIPLGSF